MNSKHQQLGGHSTCREVSAAHACVRGGKRWGRAKRSPGPGGLGQDSEWAWLRGGWGSHSCSHGPSTQARHLVGSPPGSEMAQGQATVLASKL